LVQGRDQFKGFLKKFVLPIGPVPRVERKGIKSGNNKRKSAGGQLQAEIAFIKRTKDPAPDVGLNEGVITFLERGKKRMTGKILLSNGESTKKSTPWFSRVGGTGSKEGGGDESHEQKKDGVKKAKEVYYHRRSKVARKKKIAGS